MSEISERADELIIEFKRVAMHCGNDRSHPEDRKNLIKVERKLTGCIANLEAEVAELQTRLNGIPFDTLQIGTQYLIDCHCEWDSEFDTSVLDGFTVAKYMGIHKLEGGHWFKDFYGTEMYFDSEWPDIRNVYPLPGTKGGAE